MVWHMTLVWHMICTLHFRSSLLSFVVVVLLFLGGGRAKKYCEKWQFPMWKIWKPFWYFDEYSVKSLITMRQYFGGSSVQDVHSILSETCQLFCYMFFCRLFTNLMMIARMFCQLSVTESLQSWQSSWKIMSDAVFATQLLLWLTSKFGETLRTEYLIIMCST